MRYLPLVALLALSCATRPVPRCVDLSGTYQLRGSCHHNGASSSQFVFSEKASIREISRLTIDQPGCTLTLRVNGADGKAADVRLDQGLVWTEDSVTLSWTPRSGTATLLSAGSHRVRTLTLRLSPRHDTIEVSSQFDERGLELLFIPFHAHGEASCTMQRVTS